MNRKERALEFADVGYNFKVTGRNVEVTEAMKDYALEKVSKVERLSSRIIDVNIVMDVQKYLHHVEITMLVDNTRIASTAATDDMYASIDKAVNKIEAQLRKYKQKLQDHHAKKITSIDMHVDVISSNKDEEVISDEYETSNGVGFETHQIIKKEKIPMKTLTFDEAIMKMELSGEAFMIFKNEEDQKLKVIYRREDNDFGIIEPQC